MCQKIFRFTNISNFHKIVPNFTLKSFFCFCFCFCFVCLFFFTIFGKRWNNPSCSTDFVAGTYLIFKKKKKKKTYYWFLPGGGGHSNWTVVWVCAALKTPFFRPFFLSRDPPFQAFLQLQGPHLCFFWKPKNLYQRPYFWKSWWHIYLPKLIWVSPQDSEPLRVMST